MPAVVNVNDLLDDHVVLDLECLDRIYLNAYVPNLQTSHELRERGDGGTVMATPCSRCGGLMRSTVEQVEVRLEYRSVRGLRRLRTWRIRLICRACAMAEWDAHDDPHRARGEQGTLL